MPAAGFPLELVTVSGLKRMGLRGLLRGLARLPGAFLESARILRRHRPDVVLGVGGYASGPLVFAAALLGYPTAIQEQNSLPGLHQPHAGAAGAARVHRVRRRGRPLRPPQGPLPRQSRAPVVPRTRRRRHAARPTTRARS